MTQTENTENVNDNTETLEDTNMNENTNTTEPTLAEALVNAAGIVDHDLANLESKVASAKASYEAARAAFEAARAVPSPRAAAIVQAEMMLQIPGMPEPAILAALKAQFPVAKTSKTSDAPSAKDQAPLSDEVKADVDAFIDAAASGFTVSEVWDRWSATKRSHLYQHVLSRKERGDVVKTGGGRASRWYHVKHVPQDAEVSS